MCYRPCNPSGVTPVTCHHTAPFTKPRVQIKKHTLAHHHIGVSSSAPVNGCSSPGVSEGVGWGGGWGGGSWGRYLFGSDPYGRLPELEGISSPGSRPVSPASSSCVGVLPRIVVTQALESVTACVTVGNFCYPAATEHKKHTKAWWSGLHFHCLHPRQKRVPLCLQPLPRLLLAGPPPHPLVLVPLLPPHPGPLTLLAVTAAGCTAKLITWVHIPDLVVLPLVPLQPLLLFLEGPN